MGALFHGLAQSRLHNHPVAKNGGGKILIIKARKRRRGGHGSMRLPCSTVKFTECQRWIMKVIRRVANTIRNVTITMSFELLGYIPRVFFPSQKPQWRKSMRLTVEHVILYVLLYLKEEFINGVVGYPSLSGGKVSMVLI
ncbi:hypothetical protein F4805DRAFT_438152 [Annulohypoxylon moriforme]|nr:hypothetical protein F4805DRAFT_438152 [Annulohypoxylon moriforme]